MENEELKNEVLENEGKEVSALATVQDFGALSKSTNTKAEMFTNITDQKKIFNLDSHVDNLLNDCEGELIRVKEVLIKRYKKPMKEPLIDDETGEIKTKYRTILFDENGQTYATGSYGIYNILKKIVQIYGLPESWENPLKVKVAKRPIGNGKQSLTLTLM